MTAKSYKDLIVWQKAIELVIAVYEQTKNFPKEETYGLRQQLCRFRRTSRRGSAGIQRTNSCNEVETQVLIAGRLAYLNAEQSQDLFARTNEIGRLLSGLKKSLASPNH